MGLRTISMHRLIKQILLTVALCTPLLAATSAAASTCTPQKEEELLARMFTAEAVPDPRAHAAVMSVVLTRLNEGDKWGSDICSILTRANQFVLAGKKKQKGAKYQASKKSAQTFVRQYRTQGHISEHPDVFEKLRGLNSFHAANARMGCPKGRVEIGDNCFYRAGDKKRRQARR